MRVLEYATFEIERDRISNTQFLTDFCSFEEVAVGYCRIKTRDFRQKYKFNKKKIFSVGLYHSYGGLKIDLS